MQATAAAAAQGLSAPVSDIDFNNNIDPVPRDQSPTCGVVVVCLDPWVTVVGLNSVCVTFSAYELSPRRGLGGYLSSSASY